MNTFKKVLLAQSNSDQLKRYVHEARQSRDLFIIFAALWYIANIVDAYVGASLKTFTLSDELSMKLNSNVLPIESAKSNVGLGLSLTLSLRK